jgi:hypothetical protein
MRSLSLCLLLLCPLSCLAQDARKVACRFLALGADKEPPPLINVGPDGAEIPCVIPTNTLSPDSTDCSAKGDSIQFLSADDRKPAATAKIPANLKSAILIFVAAPNKPGTPPWRVFVIEDSPKNFPEAGAFVANFHSQDIRFVIGENKTMLKPGGNHGFPRPDKRDDFNMAPVIFQFQQKDAWITASESMLRFVPGVRYLILAYVDPASGRPRISTYQDFKRTAPPAPPAAP